MGRINESRAADTVVGLQRQLNILYDFCQRSKLVVNITKTKLMVFKRGGALARPEKWTFNNRKIEVINGFYLCRFII